jgi:hypothetical protein
LVIENLGRVRISNYPITKLPDYKMSNAPRQTESPICGGRRGKSR